MKALIALAATTVLLVLAAPASASREPDAIGRWGTPAIGRWGAQEPIGRWGIVQPNPRVGVVRPDPRQWSLAVPSSRGVRAAIGRF